MISLITAPDRLFNHTFSVVLIQPPTDIKKQLEQVLTNRETPINIYLYDNCTNDIKWLLSVIHSACITIIDTDNVSTDIQQYLSYILSLPNVWYRSQLDWSLINKNRFYDFPPIHLKEIE